MKIIACDFDGTLCENRFPEIGPPHREVIARLIDERQKGTRIILWSCREGAILEEAVRWCEVHGLTFDAVNDNLPETKEWMAYNSRKVFAHEYWDDRGGVLSPEAAPNSEQ